MYTLTSAEALHGAALYDHLQKELAALLHGEHDSIANLANCSSLLYHSLPDVNWAGFYIHRNGELVLGPFQGKPACIRIPFGKGVCGTAAQRRETVVVEDVDAFPGHIACDAASRSEIVVPVLVDGELYGVLDIDSPLAGRFTEADRAGMEQLVEILIRETFATPSLWQPTDGQP